MKKIEILAYKAESFDSEVFTKDIVEYSKNSIVFLYNIKGYWIEHCPWREKRKKFYPASATFVKNAKLRYYLYPFTFLIDHLRILALFLWFCLKYGIRVIIFDTADIGIICGILRRLGFVNKTIYWCGDWFGNNKTKIGIWSGIGSKYFLPFLDYLTCKLNDLTLDITSEIAKERYRFWGKTIPKQHGIFSCRLVVKGKKATKGRKKILFLGNPREDSGLDIVLSSLKEKRGNYFFILKIAGGKGYYSEKLKEKIIELAVEKSVEKLGFIERSKFSEITADCFCGINLLTSKGSYSAKTLPAKIFDYLQYLLPVIVTENLGPVAKMIRKNKIGRVINSSKNEFSQAAYDIYKNQKKYRKNIVRFIDSYPGKNITEFV